MLLIVYSAIRMTENIKYHAQFMIEYVSLFLAHLPSSSYQVVLRNLLNFPGDACSTRCCLSGTFSNVISVAGSQLDRFPA